MQYDKVEWVMEKIEVKKEEEKSAEEKDQSLAIDLTSKDIMQ